MCRSLDTSPNGPRSSLGPVSDASLGAFWPRRSNLILAYEDHHEVLGVLIHMIRIPSCMRLPKHVYVAVEQCFLQGLELDLDAPWEAILASSAEKAGGPPMP